MDEQGNLVPVYWRDIERVGVELPSKAESVANVREGTVGVAYYDHAESTPEALHPAEDVEEDRSVEELLLQHPEVLLDSDTQDCPVRGFTNSPPVMLSQTKLRARA
ncbi:hypothetical protein R3P38DRAFT_3340942 [Favolaschia claudopus]|uniref:Uncharacterized protein n=1 Tax=Favolaschia claudopus TaxID=2862362 RepID=A0AAW0EAT0_9AGAR